MNFSLLLSGVFNLMSGSLRNANVDAQVLFALDCVALVVPLNQLTQAARTCLTLDLTADALKQVGLPTPSTAEYFALTYKDARTGDEHVAPGACIIASVVSSLAFAAIIYHLDLALFLRPSRVSPAKLKLHEAARRLERSQKGATAEDTDVVEIREMIQGWESH